MPKYHILYKYYMGNRTKSPVHMPANRTKIPQGKAQLTKEIKLGLLAYCNLWGLERRAYYNVF